MVSLQVDAMPEQQSVETARLTYAFAPLHKRAMGTAVGLIVGLLIFGLTILHLLVLPPFEGAGLWLLGQYFYGYGITWPGAFVGLFWGFVTGFVVGWFLAFVRNLVVSITVFALRTRAELKQTANFLDHI
jgi:hypothetical protein